MRPRIGPIPPNHNPWTELARIAAELLAITAPGDEDVLAQHDVALLLEATTRARVAVAEPTSGQQRAVAGLLGALDKALRGLAADLRETEGYVRDVAAGVRRARLG
jgi:hypothetical protein